MRKATGGQAKSIGQSMPSGYHNDVGTDGQDGAGGVAPLFIYAPGDAAPLSSMITAMGWQPVVERRKGHIETGFLASGARIAIVDARDDVAAGLDAVRDLADAVEINAGALLILIGNGDPASVSMAIEAGVTHVLEMPFDEDRLVQAVRLANRHSLRLAGRKPRAAVETDPGGRDALTGLGDAVTARRWVDARLAEGRPCSLLLFAITRFEMINTAFGRETGDDVLATVARLIGPLLADIGSRNTLIARTAGAEFVIGIDGRLPVERLRLLAKHLIDQVDRPVLSGPHQVSLSSRAAIAVSREGDRDAAALLRRASAALASAKAGDQSRVHVVGETESVEIEHESLKSDLRTALDRNEIKVVFQPQVSIASRRIIGVEALARWDHPTLGMLGAATLLAAAEGSDYMLALSAHIQQSALEAASRWPKSLAGLRLSVNVTASDIAQPGFADSFLALVGRSGFAKSRLTVEVTESGLIEELGSASMLLAQLRASGCRVAIDDFGTGYSSLAYLKMLPLDYLKIDKQLAQDIAGSARDRIVVRGVIDMARSLGLAVVAEGVETEEQLALLAREGCNYYQGFLCSEAVDTFELSDLVAERN
jgi:diguanylate cyclase (GGDEF)-like protein